MRLKYLLTFVVSAAFVFNIAAQQKPITGYEKKYIEVFKNFTEYLTNSISDTTDIASNSRLQYIASQFVFTNTKKDSSNGSFLTALNTSELTSFRRSIKAFYEFLQERLVRSRDSLITLPLRLYGDTWIYHHLNQFQKKNTLVFFNKKHPEIPLGYVLMLPQVEDRTTKDLIWSWLLEYKFGKFLFVSVSGQEGYEYLFSGGR